jgi:hypothetical protein
MEIGRKEMDCIHCRLLLRGLNCGLNIISRGVGIRIGLIRCVYFLLVLPLLLLLPLTFAFSPLPASLLHEQHTLSLSYISLSLLYLALALQNANVQPEWAFANILDQMYEHQSFIKEYLQPLTTKAGYDINVKVSPAHLSS